MMSANPRIGRWSALLWYNGLESDLELSFLHWLNDAVRARRLVLQHVGLCQGRTLRNYSRLTVKELVTHRKDIDLAAAYGLGLAAVVGLCLYRRGPRQ
jgi:hypothetical protein